ncbi:MAG: RagB/SusD family nutrient uptake outer membrane protein [Bacteroidales bacterium]|nr:RagB/SusD family nutrient uptake outer membrane protein [Bacteroidales bacterium]
MRKFSIILLMGLSLVFLDSCKKNFLTVPPEGQVTPSGYYSSPARATELVNAIYNNLLQWDESTFSWLGITSITSDDADKGSVAGDTGTDKNLLDNWTFTSTDFSCNEIWVANYRGISRANRALSILPSVEIDSKLKTRLIAESKFLRALYYWRLVRVFGGVPLDTVVVDPTNHAQVDSSQVRATEAQVYTQIINDWTYAANHLPTKSEYAASDLGRATQGAAEGFLSKVYMYQKDWQKAYDYSGMVISSGEYHLASDYAKIFREAGQNGPGSLFEIQAVGGPVNLGVQGYEAVQGVRGQFGWGFNVPSQALEDSFECTDGLPIDKSPLYDPNNPAKNRDPRLAATIIFPGDTLWDGTVIISDPPNPRYNMKAYISRTEETFDGNDWESNKHVHLLRYAEVLLIHAEAANELGKTDEALQYLNMVRARVNMPAVTTTDQANLRLAIWHERRYELGMEGDRTFDLIREGRAAQVLGPLGFTAPKNDLFPIPQTQIDLSNGLLTQNPGY